MVSTDKSWRTIARELGKPKSTISDYLRKFKNDPEYLDSVQVKDNAPKILLYDLETSMIKSYHWGLWQQNISIGAIIEDWYVICWSAKWLGTDAIINSSVHTEPQCGPRTRDSEHLVIRKLWDLVDEADILIAYNGKRFDRKKMNAKFLEYGLPEPSPYKVIDPMLIVKGNFALTSNKMDFVTKYIDSNDEGKLSTNLQLWIDAMEDDTIALDRMQVYCDEDINVLERVYMAVRHWDKNAPNLALHYKDDAPRCNGCGSKDLTLIPNKTSNTNLSKFTIVRCNNCCKILRTRDNVLSKEKKQSLLMNA
ncbi:ribonuclease H-like domain-containing protein [Flavobacteriaceae bacterium]|nr:ribonuclease H-like domain-containing protein [Flavobacteriaceae bacterium]